MSSKIRQIILASSNRSKQDEFQHLLFSLNIKMLPQKQFNVLPVEETGLTFIENAIIKARHASKISNYPVIADDSGLEVDVLDGAPGIWSSRYAGENATDADNIEKLLSVLENTPMSERTARFHCLLVYLKHPKDPTPIICHGIWEGYILKEPRGEKGFGYDPVFFVQEMHRTVAELTKEEKNKLSHRAIAMKQLAKKMAV